MRGRPDHAAPFHAALFGGPLPDGLRAPDASEIPRRFAVYRNNVHHSLQQALRRRFPVVERLVGADFFAALARAFVAVHPPEGPVLHRWGEAMPGFLAAFPPVAGLPYLPDVARLELARGASCHAADAPVAPAAALAAGDPEGLRLDLHPSVRLFASDWPAVSIWRANLAGGARGPVAATGPETALVGRRPDHEVIVAATDGPTHAVLSALAARLPLGAAGDRGDPTPALTLLLTHGLIARVIPGDTR